MNFIFLSPHFPPYFEKFAASLRKKGVTVIGIGDCPYNNLSQTLRGTLTEYYKVDNLENYEDVYKAVGFFIHKYGRIDFVESLNEHWLVMEAKLRTDFNIRGTQYPEVLEFKNKSAMKKFFKAAGVPSAQSVVAMDIDAGLWLGNEVGYPVIAKPDGGVGASGTFKINNETEMKQFFYKGYYGYILEEFVDGDIVTYEGLTDSEGRILFHSSHEMLHQLMDVVNEDDHVAFYGTRDIDPKVVEAGRRIAQAYQPKSRFFHFEFFRLRADHPRLGSKGDIIALEVNMRPPGGLITEIINYTYDMDVYDAWANVIAYNALGGRFTAQRYVGYASQKYRKNYVHSNDDIYRSFGSAILLRYEVEPAFRKAMGDYLYLFKADSADEIRRIVAYIQEEVRPLSSGLDNCRHNMALDLQGF